MLAGHLEHRVRADKYQGAIVCAGVLKEATDGNGCVDAGNVADGVEQPDMVA